VATWPPARDGARCWVSPALPHTLHRGWGLAWSDHRFLPVEEEQMLFIVVKFTVQPEQSRDWLSKVADFTAATRAEPGNVFFEWSKSVDDPHQKELNRRLMSLDRRRSRIRLRRSRQLDGAMNLDEHGASHGHDEGAAGADHHDARERWGRAAGTAAFRPCSRSSGEAEGTLCSERGVPEDSAGCSCVWQSTGPGPWPSPKHSPAYAPSRSRPDSQHHRHHATARDHHGDTGPSAGPQRCPHNETLISRSSALRVEPY